jgi:hypothetical protein
MSAPLCHIFELLYLDGERSFRVEWLYELSRSIGATRSNKGENQIKMRLCAWQ